MKNILNELQRILKHNKDTKLWIREKGSNEVHTFNFSNQRPNIDNVEQTYTMYDGHYDWDEQPTDNISF
jgi:hypothetical protein